MCDPVTISVAALGIAGTQVAAQQQADDIGDQHNAGAAAAVEANALNQAQINVQASQENTDLATAKLDADLDNQQRISRVQVASGETGGFLNNQAALQEVVRQGIVQQDRAGVGQERAQLAQQQQREGVQRQTQSRINSLPKPSVNKMALGLSALGSAGSAATSAGYGMAAKKGGGYGMTRNGKMTNPNNKLKIGE